MRAVSKVAFRTNGILGGWLLGHSHTAEPDALAPGLAARGERFIPSGLTVYQDANAIDTKCVTSPRELKRRAPIYGTGNHSVSLAGEDAGGSIGRWQKAPS